MRPSSVFVLLALACVSTPAFAQTDQATPRASTITADESGRDVRSQANEWIIPPDGSGSVGGNLTFLTADFAPGFGEIGFTDIVLFGINARYSVAGVAEVFGATTLLPKQPSFTEELAWQSGSLGFRVGLAEWLATSLTVASGSTLDANGTWAGGQLGLDARFPLHDFVKIDLGLFGTGTALFLDGDETPWFVEVLSNLQIAFMGNRMGGAWVGFDLAFPVADDGLFNATTRSNFHVGGVLSFIDDWDIYAKYSFIDRGDVEELDTLLPILAGGFDQQQMTFGLSYRFTPDKEE